MELSREVRLGSWEKRQEEERMGQGSVLNEDIPPDSTRDM